jgi:hypothetical protein
LEVCWVLLVALDHAEDAQGCVSSFLPAPLRRIDGARLLGASIGGWDWSPLT